MKKTAFLSLLVLIVASSLSYSQAKKNSTVTSGNLKFKLLNITELNDGIGLNQINVDFSKHVFNFSSICGIGLARNITGGIGAGVSFYNGGTLVPLFADFRYFKYIGTTKVFVFGEGGILLNSVKNTGGNIKFAGPGVGMVLPLSNNLSVSLGAGLLTQFREDKSHDSFVMIKPGMIYLFKKN